MARPKLKLKKKVKDTFPRPNTDNQNNGGRKVFDGKNAEKVLSELKEAFSWGSNIERACAYAKISYQSFNRYMKGRSELQEEFDQLRLEPLFKAEAIILEKLKAKDLDIAKWILERRAKKEYALRQEFTGPEGAPIETEVNKEHFDRVLKILKENGLIK